MSKSQNESFMSDWGCYASRTKFAVTSTYQIEFRSLIIRDCPASLYEAFKCITRTLLQVEAYRNKSYFLIHGTADDNVHYQHAMLISRLLQRRDVYFTQMVRDLTCDYASTSDLTCGSVRFLSIHIFQERQNVSREREREKF